MKRHRNRLESAVLAHLLDLHEIHQFLHVVLDLREADQLVQLLHGILLRLFFFRSLRGRLCGLRCGSPRRGFPRHSGIRRETAPGTAGSRVRAPACSGKTGKQVTVAARHQPGINIIETACAIQGIPLSPCSGSLSGQRRHPVIKRIVQKRLHFPQRLVCALERVCPRTQCRSDLFPLGFQLIDPVSERRLSPFGLLSARFLYSGIRAVILRTVSERKLHVLCLLSLPA